MRNFKFNTICLFLILSSLPIYSQEKTNDCLEIYGEWKTYYIQQPFGIDSGNKSETWIFNKDKTLSIDGKMTKYSLEEDCSKLIIENDSKSFFIKIIKDTLIMTKRILPHESYDLRLKKIKH
ncbi:hypothetical protein [Flavobacterium aquicola]|uniref:Lipocalin-like protein n=1 Tax=Flavobacterium aquicola TaxID=1682742 RepID=A0A3E0EMG3_9FLAO|nr:hypothetical protein [Flavobacterium aquicola]REG98509.1 hypothetical protein C8P67_106108 [Flavobacterium aquicola]